MKRKNQNISLMFQSYVQIVNIVRSNKGVSSAFGSVNFRKTFSFYNNRTIFSIAICSSILTILLYKEENKELCFCLPNVLHKSKQLFSNLIYFQLLSFICLHFFCFLPTITNKTYVVIAYYLIPGIRC